MDGHSDHSVDTNAVHAGSSARHCGAVVTPVFSTVNYASTIGQAGEYHSCGYSRLNNTPNHLALHSKFCALEGTEDALVTSCGMAAISLTLLTLLKTGDHAIFQDTLYGGTMELIEEVLPSFQIDATQVSGQDLDGWERALRPNTRLIYVEAITNPLIEIADLEAVVAFAKRHNILSVIDATFASPVNFKPYVFGFDIVIHSATKYMNGHSDVTAGFIGGSKDLIRKITHRNNILGSTLDMHACFLLERGMKTLGLRVRAQSANAQRLAEYLESRSDVVRRVNYPGLASHRQHERATRLFTACGGMLSFELNGGPITRLAFLRSLRIPVVAPSLGSIESLICVPAETSHSGIPREKRLECGITDDLIRFSVGAEDGDDLLADIGSALDAAVAALNQA